jgi:two-component system CheB/CheR fusion protein
VDLLTPTPFPDSSAIAVPRGIERLIAVVEELSFCRDLPHVMETVRHAARALTGADGAAFILREGDQCHYVDEDAIGPLWKGRRFPVTACISGWAMLHRQAVAIEDVYTDPRIPVDAYQPTFVKSLAMVPVRKEAPVAAIGTYWASRHAPSASELTVLQAIADATALSLQNVTLYEDRQRTLQEAQDARREAEMANRLKDEFLATLSHELRTPLNAILGWVKMARRGAVTDIPRVLEIVERNAQTQHQIVCDLLDATAVITGKLSLSVQSVAPRAIVEAVLDAMSPAITAKRLTVTRSLQDVGFVFADPDRLRQVISNLVSNAVKLTPEDGEIRVELSRVESRLRLVVSDNGVGIRPEFLVQMFERSRQADGSSTRVYSGLGLGLAIARHLVELHGGTIRAHSPGEGHGATFTVDLPVDPGGPERLSDQPV